MNYRCAFLALLLATSCGAQAEYQQDNLRGLTGADLCPPTSYVYIEEEENEDLAAQLDAALDKYAALYSIPYGDPKTCTVNQSFVVDTFKSSERYVYTVHFYLELRHSAVINLSGAEPTQAAQRTLSIRNVQLWNDRGFGTVSDLKNVPIMSTEQVRNSYETFALAWKTTHKK